MQLWELLKSTLVVKKTYVVNNETMFRYIIPNRLLSINIILSNDDKIWLVHQVNAASAAFLATKQNLEYPVSILNFDKSYYIAIDIGSIVAPFNKLPTIDYLMALLKHYAQYAVIGGEYSPLAFNPTRKYYA